MKELPLGQTLLFIFWLPGWAELCHRFHRDTEAGQPLGPREPSVGLPPRSGEPGLLSACLSRAFCSEHCGGSLECPGLEHGELTRSHFSVGALKCARCVRGCSAWSQSWGTDGSQSLSCPTGCSQQHFCQSEFFQGRRGWRSSHCCLPLSALLSTNLSLSTNNIKCFR